MLAADWIFTKVDSVEQKSNLTINRALQRKYSLALLKRVEIKLLKSREFPQILIAKSFHTASRSPFPILSTASATSRLSAHCPSPPHHLPLPQEVMLHENLWKSTNHAPVLNSLYTAAIEPFSMSMVMMPFEAIGPIPDPVQRHKIFSQVWNISSVVTVGMAGVLA